MLDGATRISEQTTPVLRITRSQIHRISQLVSSCLLPEMSRGIWSTVFKNFVASLRPRQINGNLMGEDHMKNKYYEIPADPRGGKRRPSRWFEPAEKGNFEQEIPAEWEAWLRNRRVAVPTSEEVIQSLAISQMKKENAKKVTIQNPFVHEPSEVPSPPKFPVFEDYERADHKRK